MKELKRVSNLWLKKKGETYAEFGWRGGYAVYTVSQSNVEQVTRYVENQENHHKKMTFEQELRALLKKHRMEWDERYLWD